MKRIVNTILKIHNDLLVNSRRNLFEAFEQRFGSRLRSSRQAGSRVKTIKTTLTESAGMSHHSAFPLSIRGLNRQWDDHGHAQQTTMTKQKRQDK